MSNNKPLLLEIWEFLKVRKAWWLAPIIIMLILVGALIIFGQSSALSPFIYALFLRSPSCIDFNYFVYQITCRITLNFWN